MSIHPQYAEAILDGRKRIEFRKRPLASDVRTVVIYATAPVKAIVGEFTIEEIVKTTPARLWALHGSVGGIDRSSYTAYYAGSASAAGIRVKAARRYPQPIPLTALNPVPAIPQSFSYLPSSAIMSLLQPQTSRGVRKSLLRSLAAAMAGLVYRLLPASNNGTVILLPTQPGCVEPEHVAHG